MGEESVQRLTAVPKLVVGNDPEMYASSDGLTVVILDGVGEGVGLGVGLGVGVPVGPEVGVGVAAPGAPMRRGSNELSIESAGV
jgi:hypothetical protein